MRRGVSPILNKACDLTENSSSCHTLSSSMSECVNEGVLSWPPSEWQLMDLAALVA